MTINTVTIETLLNILIIFCDKIKQLCGGFTHDAESESGPATEQQSNHSTYRKWVQETRRSKSDTCGLTVSELIYGTNTLRVQDIPQ